MVVGRDDEEAILMRARAANNTRSHKHKAIRTPTTIASAAGRAVAIARCCPNPMVLHGQWRARRGAVPQPLGHLCRLALDAGDIYHLLHPPPRSQA